MLSRSNPRNRVLGGGRGDPQRENPDTDYRTGNELHLDVALSQYLSQQLSIGVIDALSTFQIALMRNDADVEHGSGANVLNGPLSALHHLVGLLMDDRTSPKLSAGEIVSTGTLTRALPIAPGERWSTKLSGIQLPGVDLTLV